MKKTRLKNVPRVTKKICAIFFEFFTLRIFQFSFSLSLFKQFEIFACYRIHFFHAVSEENIRELFKNSLKSSKFQEKLRLSIQHLLFSLKECFAMFKEENPDAKIGLKKFCALEPFNIRSFTKLH